MLELTLQSLLTGVLAGGYYLLLGLGLSLVFGTMRVVNLAHGEVALLSAYLCYVAEEKFGVNPLLMLPAAVLAAGVASLAIGVLVGRLGSHRELTSLMLTYGLSGILVNLYLITFTANPYSTSSPFFNEAIYVGPYYLTAGSLVFAVLGVVLAGGLAFWVRGTWAGRGVRALASNRLVAALCTVNARRTETLAFFVAGCLAGVAGVALYALQSIGPGGGHVPTLKAFVITVLAGVGSISGVVLASGIIGIAEALTTTLVSSSLRDLVTFLLFLGILILRPAGLLGVKELRGSRR